MTNRFKEFGYIPCFVSIAGIIAMALFFTFSCKEEGCEESECYNYPRVCVEIIPYAAEPEVCEQVTVSYTDNQGKTHYDEECGHHEQWSDHYPSSCAAPGPSTEWYDIRIVQNDEYESTKRIELAKHNYCGEDIAYVVVTLHEGSLPTFGETFYVSPCENRGL